MLPPPPETSQPRAPAPSGLWYLGLLAVGACLLAMSWSDAVQEGHSGELTAAACGLGVTRPPGHPLFVLLGHGFCLLPWSTPAGRLALLSACCALWAMLTLFATVWQIGRSRWAAAMAALVWITGDVLWREASQGSVFTLEAALCATVALCALRLSRAPGSGGPFGWSLCTWLALGLALATHHQAVLVAPLALAATFWPPRPAPALAARLAGAVLGLSAGLAAYLQILLADPDAAPRWGDPLGWRGLVNHALDRDLGAFAAGHGGELEPLTNLGAYLTDLPVQLGGVLWPFCLLGLAASAHRAAGRPLGRLLERALRRDLAALLALLPLLAGPLYMLMFSFGEGGESVRRAARPHQLLSVLLLCLLLGVGLTLLDQGLLRVRDAGGAHETSGAARSRLWHTLGLVIVGLMAAVSYPRARLDDDFIVEDFARDCLGSAERGAALLAEGPTRCWSLALTQRTMSLRPDVQVVCMDLLRFPWYVAQLRRQRPGFSFRAGAGERADLLRMVQGELRRGVPVNLASGPASGLLGAFGAYPAGPLLRLVPPGRDPPEPRAMLALNRRLFAGFSRRGRRPVSMEALRATGLLEPYARTWQRVARELMAMGDHREALRAMLRANDWAPWLAVPRWFGGEHMAPRRAGAPR